MLGRSSYSGEFLEQGVSILGFLIPLSPPPPLRAQETLSRQTLRFSDRQWTVRQTAKPEGPGGNVFGGKDLGVLLNQDGSLTLRVFQKDGIWHAGEVTLQQRTGYGEYIFRLRTAPGELDPNLVLGLFTYSGASAYHHREIDIEFSAGEVQTSRCWASMSFNRTRTRGICSASTCPG